jgi:hypothetical protein
MDLRLGERVKSTPSGSSWCANGSAVYDAKRKFPQSIEVAPKTSGQLTQGWPARRGSAVWGALLVVEMASGKLVSYMRSMNHDEVGDQSNSSGCGWRPPDCLRTGSGDAAEVQETEELSVFYGRGLVRAVEAGTGGLTLARLHARAMEMTFRVRAAEVSRDQHPSDTIDFTLCPSRRRHRPPPSGDGALCPRVDLAPTLPAHRTHNRSALVRREERRADFTSLDAMRKILIGDVGLRFLRLGREGIGACGRQGDAGSGAREILKQIAPRPCCRTESNFRHLEVLLATIPQAECRPPSDEE